VVIVVLTVATLVVFGPVFERTSEKLEGIVPLRSGETPSPPLTFRSAVGLVVGGVVMLALIGGVTLAVTAVRPHAPGLLLILAEAVSNNWEKIVKIAAAVWIARLAVRAVEALERIGK
jgi:hypothetical protein